MWRLGMASMEFFSAMGVTTVAVLSFIVFQGLQSLEEIFHRGTTECPHCPLLTGPCSSEWVSYRLYDRKHSDTGQYVLVSDSWNNLSAAGYNPQISTAVLIHGFADSIRQYSLVEIKDELLKVYDMFVMMMDWSKAVPDGCYVAAVHNVRYAGRCLADLTEAVGKPATGLHVIGHSLGAHVPASAADLLYPYKIPRITGLDPALPLFWGYPSQRRLRKTDGKFVDVIHTNALIQGHILPLGHADFYVNGGSIQPGCSDFQLFNFSVKEIMQCSHERAPVYFAESINSSVGFWGCKTSSYFHIKGSCKKPEEVVHLMGYHVDTQLRGIVILHTAKEPPFALGKPVIEKINVSHSNIVNNK